MTTQARRIGLIGMVLCAHLALSGCGLAPRTFRALKQPEGIKRARAATLADRLPDARAIPPLIGRLDDPDPVVRMAAHEELKKRTGKNFGYEPWLEDAAERAPARDKWRAWWQSRESSLSKSSQIR